MLRFLMSIMHHKQQIVAKRFEFEGIEQKILLIKFDYLSFIEQRIFIRLIFRNNLIITRIKIE
jgi:hypothetical protein